jgi:hypothetical protein
MRCVTAYGMDLAMRGLPLSVIQVPRQATLALSSYGALPTLCESRGNSLARTGL